MSVDEMIKLLLSHAITDRVFGGTSYDTIISALKAGQAMRDTAAFFPDAIDGPIAWDEATKEDV